MYFRTFLVVSILLLLEIFSFSADPAVSLQMTYPAGESPRVFTRGWMFGAKCVINPGQPDQKDVSSEVLWTGTGRFQPSKGAFSRPLFTKPGDNTIVLSITVDGKKTEKEYHVIAVAPDKFARVNSIAECEADAHGCGGCPHPVRGPVITGSSTVIVDGLPAARVGDRGVHASCCGGNTFEIVQGDPEVLIDGRKAARIGDATKHCGGSGKIKNTGDPYEPYGEFPLTFKCRISKLAFHKHADIGKTITFTRRWNVSYGVRKNGKIVRGGFKTESDHWWINYSTDYEYMEGSLDIFLAFKGEPSKFSSKVLLFNIGPSDAKTLPSDFAAEVRKVNPSAKLYNEFFKADIEVQVTAGFNPNSECPGGLKLVQEAYISPASREMMVLKFQTRQKPFTPAEINSDSKLSGMGPMPDSLLKKFIGLYKNYSEQLEKRAKQIDPVPLFKVLTLPELEQLSKGIPEIEKKISAAVKKSPQEEQLKMQLKQIQELYQLISLLMRYHHTQSMNAIHNLK